jgi:DNA-binding NarL/FixJ family response regulator
MYAAIINSRQNGNWSGSDTEIAEKLHLSLSTVESHRKNVRHKLMAKNSAEMVRIAMERGLS